MEIYVNFCIGIIVAISCVLVVPGYVKYIRDNRKMYPRKNRRSFWGYIF